MHGLGYRSFTAKADRNPGRSIRGQFRGEAVAAVRGAVEWKPILLQRYRRDRGREEKKWR